VAAFGKPVSGARMRPPNSPLRNGRMLSPTRRTKPPHSTLSSVTTSTLFNTLSPCLTGAAATTSPFFVEHLALEDAEAVAHQHGALGGVTHRARIDVSTPHTTKEPAHRCA